MAARLLVPWMGFHPGDVVDRGEELDDKLIGQGIAERVEIVSKSVERAAYRPKDKR